jgi:hypothetical protein
MSVVVATAEKHTCAVGRQLRRGILILMKASSSVQGRAQADRDQAVGGAAVTGADAAIGVGSGAIHDGPQQPLSGLRPVGPCGSS